MQVRHPSAVIMPVGHTGCPPLYQVVCHVWCGHAAASTGLPVPSTDKSLKSSAIWLLTQAVKSVQSQDKGLQDDRVQSIVRHPAFVVLITSSFFSDVLSSLRCVAFPCGCYLSAPLFLRVSS